MRRQRIILSLSTIFMIGIIVVWLVQILNDQVPLFDQWSRDLALSQNDTKWYIFFVVLTKLGSRTFLIPFTIVMGLLLWWLYQDWLPALLLSGGTLFTHYLNQTIKNIIARERPSISAVLHAEGYSFPSGHAMLSMVCYGLFTYYIVKKLPSQRSIFLTQFFFALLIFFIGFSRIALHVHYATDVMSGFFGGFLCLIGWMALDHHISTRRGLS
ncbi:MAG TPA: phosphatase PAP2 family protein [Bacillota bacterium]|nr:phosphatase PAP2 family protein [Bacillota bacterium]